MHTDLMHDILLRAMPIVAFSTNNAERCGNCSCVLSGIVLSGRTPGAFETLDDAYSFVARPPGLLPAALAEQAYQSIGLPGLDG